MNKLLVRAPALALVVLGAGSCAVYKDPVYVTTIDAGWHMGPENKAGRDLAVNAASAPAHAASHPHHTQVAVAPAAPASVPSPKTQVIEACERIVPPVIGQIPRLGPAEILEVSKLPASEANRRLLDELELIYKYASGKNKELQNSFAKQWNSCRKVTVLIQ